MNRDNRIFRDIIMIGAGNVGTQLALALDAAGHSPSFVWSRSLTAAGELAEQLRCPFSNDWSKIPPSGSFYILAVPDDQIGRLGSKLAKHVTSSNPLVVHTSGATPDTVLSKEYQRFGVFYPLQTFSKNKVVDFSTVPLCLYANKESDLQQLEQLGKLLSRSVQRVDGQQRLQLHLAAIFVNNFTNYLQHISSGLLEEAGLNADLLQPLLKETVAKLDDLSPIEAQTGPAVRGDQETIRRHLDLLVAHPEWQAIYQLLSERIAKEMR